MVAKLEDEKSEEKFYEYNNMIKKLKSGVRGGEGFMMNKNNGKKPKNMKIENKETKDYDLKFYSNNCRGLQSKIDTVKNILREGKIDIAIITETQCARDKNIKIENYVCYYRNRHLRDKGGVAIYVHEKWANGCMKLETGLEHNEFFVIKLENFTPNVVVIGYYGVIEGQYNKDQVTAMQADIFNLFRKYKEEGYQIFWSGDYNNHIPNECGIVGNPGKPSNGGINLVNFVKEENLEILNSRDNYHTHYDRSEGVSRILDLVVTNAGESVKEFKVDKKLEFTPYRIKKCKGGHFRSFSDHMGLKWVVRVKANECKTNKRVVWNFNKTNGNTKYEELTDFAAYEIETFIDESDDVEEIYSLILRKIEEAKCEAYGKVTKTKSQLKRMADSQIWKQRTKDVEKAIGDLKKHKVTDRLWEMRGKVSDKYADKQFVGVKNPSTGLMTKDINETFETTLEYNYNLLRKDKDIGNLSVEEIANQEAKDIVIKHAIENGCFKEDDELVWKDYERVIEKIKLNNKNVYRDFIKAGERMKEAIFKFYQKCYKLEKMPESFSDTELLRLYKGKGDRTELQKNRFLHLKPWGPKVYEKLIMTKIEDKMFNHTPEMQVGGQKMGSTNEHLLSMIMAMRRLEKKQGGAFIIFMDIKACFDRIKLNDILFEAVQCGVTGRPLKNIKTYTNNLNIRIQGDPDENRVRSITNSTGQGSGFAPVGTSMVMARTLVNKIENKSESEQKILTKQVDSFPLKHNFFVDDLSKPCEELIEVQVNCKVITEMLTELGLQAHPDKSGVLVFGLNKEQFKDEMLNDPPTVQDFDMGVKKSETYLGMIFDEDGADASITKTLEARKYKCLTKAADIKRKLEDERMEGLGWLAGVTLIHSAVIISTLTYGAAAFTGMDVKHWEMLENIQRQCLIHVLGVSIKTTHVSLLYCLGLSPVKDIIKKLQISFVNNLIHIKGKGQCLEALLADQADGVKGGLLEEVSSYCEEYGLPDVVKHYVPPEVIKSKIERIVLDRQWIENLKAKKPPLSVRRDSRAPKFYATLPKNKAKLMLCYEMGELNFRKGRKSEAMSRYGSIQCLVPHCGEDDELNHVKTCDGYSSRVKDDAGPYEFIDYLASLELERNTRFRKSLINFKTL